MAAIHDALHRAGHRTTYHTCGGMMHILDLITQNGTDASETLAPPAAAKGKIWADTKEVYHQR